MKRVILICFVIETFFNIYSLFSFKNYYWYNPSCIYSDVAMLDTNNFIVTGACGKLIRTKDGGKTFEWLIYNSNKFFTNVKYINESTVISIADSGYVYISNDDCKSWNISKICDDYISTIAVKDNIIFIGGVNGIFKSKDAGKSFINVYYKDSIQIYDIKIVNDKIAYASVRNGVLKTTDGGISWFETIIHNKMQIFWGIDFLDDKVGFVSMQDTNLVWYDSYKLLKTSDGGTNWDTIPFSMIARKIKIFNDSKMIALGDSICRSSDFFASWTSDSLLAPFSIDGTGLFRNPQNSVTYDNKGNLISIGSSSIYKYKNYGENPVLINSSLILRQYTEGAIERDSNELFIFASRGRVYKSIDKGKSINYSYPIFGNLRELNDSLQKFWDNILGSNTYFRYGFSNNNRIEIYGMNNNEKKPNLSIETTDDGAVWRNTDKIPCMGPISFYNDSFAIAFYNYQTGDGNYLFFSDDKCYNWRKELFSNKEIIRSIHCFEDSILFLFCEHSEKTDDTINFPTKYKYIFKILKSNNRGKNFDTIFSVDNSIYFIYSLHFFSANHCLIICNNKQIKETRDCFNTLTNASIIPPFNSNQYLIFDYNNIVANNSNSVAISEDGGRTWESELIYNGSNSLLYPVKLSNKDFLVTGRNIFIVFRRKDTTTQIEKEYGSRYYNNDFYITINPSPVDNYAKITLYGLYSVPNLPLNVKIYNINAGLVKDLSSEAIANNNGYYSSFTVNLNDMQRGIYFVELQAGSHYFVRKLIKK